MIQATHSKTIDLRCFFLEKSRGAYRQLAEFANAIGDMEIECRNATLEHSVGEIGRFITHAKNTFPFIFVDPTGWTGFDLEVIRPLLRIAPGEVLINFMTGHIWRFFDSPNQKTQQSFERLFGANEYQRILNIRDKHDQDDAIAMSYLRIVKKAGGFRYAGLAVVLHPQINRSHFHLIYLTRHPRGLEVFKDAEFQAMRGMEAARAEAQQTRREMKGQKELFEAAELHDTAYFDGLRDRYCDMAKQTVLAELKDRRDLPYDTAWEIAMEFPLVWEADLKNWIKDWIRKKSLSVAGLKTRQRVPKRMEKNLLVWKAEKLNAE